ncbi:RNA binding protein [Oryctes borbonicus]|uniref:RNA-binding region-containing protein 3 n=1 Tax=Oryctes borbonicus TaxID=1629725 RepID=A0A0T6AUF9_9SCAR|nr:RNA binding protein [Oryctes borbonicus]
MVCEDTLKIKNLPMDLSDQEKEDFLRHFGAQKVKLMTFVNKQKSIVFAQFESKEIAKSVLLRLHQIKILNSRLCVEYAEHDIVQDKPRLKKPETVKGDKNNFKKFIQKLNAFNSAVSFYQPPPSHLRYAYPKPNRATINNIAHALASVPKFYTQVLHLMNRMNLPPPFSDIPDPPQVSIRLAPQPIVRPIASETKEKSSSESEIESDPESSGQLREIIPIKRNLPQKKLVKRPKFIKPPPINVNTQKGLDKTDEFFERTEIQKHKIELKVTTQTLSEIAEDTSKKVEENMEVEEENNQAESKSIINEEELKTNRIPSKELSVLPVFKDYHPGAPTNRLYIKNIAKTVELKDLEYIYKRYVKIDDTVESIFNIRLMQEGRMKGQAFVTLDNVQLAQEALDETNGYILKDRPLVVVFAKSAAPRKS